MSILKASYKNVGGIPYSFGGGAGSYIPETPTNSGVDLTTWKPTNPSINVGSTTKPLPRRFS